MFAFEDGIVLYHFKYNVRDKCIGNCGTRGKCQNERWIREQNVCQEVMHIINSLEEKRES